ncbi:MAG: hypothetical protein ACRDQA_27900, partial [Nocardioidaceae bacterium]
VKGHLDAGDVELLLGGGLGATGEIGVGAGRTWEVDPGDAETLIRALTAENQAAMGGPHGAVPGANIFTDSLIPEPDRAGISGEAAEEIYSELGLVDSAGGEARHEDGVQLFRERGGDHGIRYSTSDDVNGETHAPLAKLSHLTGDTPTGTATTSRSTEFTFDQDGTPEQVKVQTVHGTGSEQHVSTTTVDLDSDQMRHDAKVLAKAMHNPTEENLNEAADVDVHSWGTGNRDDADLKVGSTDFGGGFELSPLWKGLGASIDIEHTKIDYDYNGR